MRDLKGLGMMALIMLMRHSRELALIAVLLSAASLVWAASKVFR